MKSLRFIGMSAILLLGALVTFAYPNLNATTGILATPNAYITPCGTLMGAADMLLLSTTTLNTRVLFGVTDRFEAGGAVIAGGDTGFEASCKYELGTLPSGVACAAGATLLGANHSANGSQFFLVATKSFLPGVMPSGRLLGSFGINVINIHKSDTLPFLGVQLSLSPETELGAEYEFKGSDPFNEPILSLVVRQRLPRDYYAEIGFTNADSFLGEKDHKLFFGIAGKL